METLRQFTAGCFTWTKNWKPQVRTTTKSFLC